MKGEDDVTLLKRVLYYCGKIDRAMNNHSDDELKFSEQFQDLSSFYIIQIGENVGGLSEHVTLKNPEVRWRGIVNMRNVMAHGYEGFDVERWWKTISVHIPILKGTCEKILKELGASEV